MNNYINKLINIEFVRFGIVGILATIIHYLIYWLLLNYFSASISYTIGYALSFVCNFYLSSKFTFKSKATIQKGLGFGLSHLVNYILQIVILNISIWIGIAKIFAPIPVYFICIPINFLLVRYVFKH